MHSVRTFDSLLCSSHGGILGDTSKDPAESEFSLLLFCLFSFETPQNDTVGEGATVSIKTFFFLLLLQRVEDTRGQNNSLSFPAVKNGRNAGDVFPAGNLSLESLYSFSYIYLFLIPKVCESKQFKGVFLVIQPSS